VSGPGAALDQALEAEARAYRELLAGEPASEALVAARDAYLASHAGTGPASWGRLLGALKMAILAGDGVDQVAAQALAETEGVDSPASAYLRALAQVASGVPADAESMLAEGGAFARTGEALAALAARDRAGYDTALAAILADFEARDQFLTGVAVADTVMVLEALAEPRGMALRPRSPLLPA
jgi:hypothetical protein